MRYRASPSSRPLGVRSYSTHGGMTLITVRSIKPSGRGELEITDAIQWLVDNNKTVRSHLVTGYWKDTGRLEDMLECNRKVLESVEPQCHGTVDDMSRVIGLVIIVAVLVDTVLKENKG